jgi:hypothetical protein
MLCLDMTPEERYEIIDRRIDAISLNLELTAQVAHENEIKIGELADRLTKLTETIREVAEAQKIDTANIRALARIAEIHEHRLSDLEGGRPS